MAASSLFSPIRGQLPFICRRCLTQQRNQSSQTFRRTLNQPIKSLGQTPFLAAFRKPGHYRSPIRYNSSATLQPPPSTSPLGALSRDITRETTHTTPTTPTTPTTLTTSSFPTTSSNSVAYWLLASAASVFGIVIFGGLTRLTESGLSITEWRPVTGSRPPTTQEHWEVEFARYKLSPEFKMLNSRMDLEDFRQIYWMEWTHRLWGRVVGMTFLVPTAYFIVRKRVSKPMALRLVGISGLIGFQGFLGWWMVKSGLKDDLFAPGSHPRVSQYRLAAHLGTAFIAYLLMLHNGLAILRQNRLLANPTAALSQLQTLASPQLRPFRRLTTALLALTFTTAISGALVAGLDAGLIYNDFPWMGQRFFPPQSELFDPFYSHTPSQADLWWRNMLENPVLVQLDHRILATTTFTAIMGLWAYTLLSPRVKTALPKSARKGMLGVVHLVCLQVALGISTLWYLVPTPLAAAHQAGALALLSGVVVLGSRVWIPGRTLRLVEQAVAVGKSGVVQGGVGHRGADALLKARLGR